MNSLLEKTKNDQDLYNASGTIEKPECKASQCLRLMAKGSVMHSLGECMKIEMCVIEAEEQRNF